MLGKRLLSGGKNYRKTVCTILNCAKKAQTNFERLVKQ